MNFTKWEPKVKLNDYRLSIDYKWCSKKSSWVSALGGGVGLIKSKNIITVKKLCWGCNFAEIIFIPIAFRTFM